MATGVKVDPSTIELYKIFKLRKTPHRFVVLYIDLEAGFIKIERTVDKNEDISQEDEYNSFISSLPTNEGRYFWADLTVTGKSGAARDIMFSVAW